MKVTIANDGIRRFGYHWFGRLHPERRNYFSTRMFWLIVHLGRNTIYIWR